MKEVLLNIIKAVIKAGLTLVIVPFVMVGMLLLSIYRLVFCLAILIFKPRQMGTAPSQINLGPTV